MNRTTASAMTVAILILLAVPAQRIMARAHESGSQANTMSIWQARRISTGLPPQGSNYLFSVDSFEFSARRWSRAMGYREMERYKIDLLAAPAVRIQCKPSQCAITDEAGRSLPEGTALGRFFSNIRWTDPRDLRDPNSGTHSEPITCTDSCVKTAQSFADAFNELRAFAKNTDAPLRNFPQLAAAWRALAIKPPVPEQVRVQRLMAEDAVKNNKPAEALAYYEAGIELYTTWPEGNFNAALIAGDLGYFADAIEHMQAYLELEPDAADAQAARDKITTWQVKSK